jgi:hypothetical protein
MPKKKESPPKRQQLLVEGKNDRHVIWALCQKYQVPQTFSVEIGINDGSNQQKNQGVEELLDGIPVILKEENLETLGIVVDADQDLAARWQGVTNKLKKFGYRDIPPAPLENGWIHTQEEKPKIGVWVMPDNQLPGMLEDFVAYLIPAEDKLQGKAHVILEEIEREALNPYSLTHHQKALIHTWLAWQQTPGMPMGQAITAKALCHDSAIAKRFIDWLNDLFGSGQKDLVG